MPITISPIRSVYRRKVMIGRTASQQEARVTAETRWPPEILLNRD